MTTAGPSHGSDCPHKSNPSAPHNEGVWRKFPTESQELRRKRRCYCACLFGTVSRNGSRPEKRPAFSPQDRSCECRFVCLRRLLHAPKGKASGSRREKKTPENWRQRGNCHEKNRSVS